MRLILLTLFAPSTADFAWESSAPAYHATAALADSEDSASCCGCERVSDPAYGEDGLSCPCDATAGACDAGCCCDTSDCTASELVDVFGCPSAGAPGGAGRAGVTYCSDLLARANIPQTAAARGWSDVTDLDGLLCVQTDNSESRGAFLSDPFPTCSALSSQDESDVLDHLRAEENVGNLTAFRQWLAPAAAAVSGDSRYTLGAPVLGDGCVDAVDDAGCSRRAPLLLPARGPSGACEGSQLVPYLTDTAPYACNTPAAMPIAELCAGWLNATVLLRQKVASSPVSSDAALALSYLLYNTTTGAYDAVDAPPAGASFFSLHLPPPPLLPSRPPPAPQPPLPPHPSSPLAARLVTPPRKTSRRVAFLTSDGDCFSALTSLEYRLTVSAEGKITAAAAYLVTEDVSSASAAAGVAQSLALGFEHQDAPVTSRPISGRPGYVRGRPVLIADSFGGAFALRTDALQLLPRGARGQCSTDGPATPLSFGDDLALSCVVRSLPPPELKPTPASAERLQLTRCADRTRRRAARRWVRRRRHARRPPCPRTAQPFVVDRGRPRLRRSLRRCSPGGRRSLGTAQARLGRRVGGTIVGRTEWYLQEHAQGRRTPARPSPNAPPATGHACACSRSTTPPLSVRLRAAATPRACLSFFDLLRSTTRQRSIRCAASSTPSSRSRHRTWVCHVARSAVAAPTARRT